MIGVHEEAVREGRLSLAHILIGNPPGIGVKGFDRESASLLGYDKLNGKIVARMAMRSFEFTMAGHQMKAETLGVATDTPNLIDFKKWSDTHREVYERNVDSLLLAWGDPPELLVPIMGSQDIWLYVQSIPVVPEPKPDKVSSFSSETREFFVPTPLSGALMVIGRMKSIGTMDFPFSTLMIRSLAISWWQANKYDHELFHQECFVCKKNLDQLQGFANRWAASFTGKCNTCVTLEADLSGAVPTW